MALASLSAGMAAVLVHDGVSLVVSIWKQCKGSIASGYYFAVLRGPGEVQLLPKCTRYPCLRTAIQTSIDILFLFEICPEVGDKWHQRHKPFASHLSATDLTSQAVEGIQSPAKVRKYSRSRRTGPQRRGRFWPSLSMDNYDDFKTERANFWTQMQIRGDQRRGKSVLHAWRHTSSIPSCLAIPPAISPGHILRLYTARSNLLLSLGSQGDDRSKITDPNQRE
ncbi:hypothetical protein KC340_g14 [Hortaea werneckii]|nr:hypothetical protein KC340_g14 [Hortaea werneckii]